MIIQDNEIHPFNAITLDDIGEVFEWHGHILRGINESAIHTVKAYFETGFIDEIVKKGLFPKTKISEYTHPRYALILEHEKISPALTDSEWSFDMLKDAAILVLRIAQIGLKYGFNMKDCHTKNILFNNNQPMFVDLGSFVLNKKGVNTYFSYKPFMSSYTYLLKMWANGLVKIPKQLHTIAYLEQKEYEIFQNPIYRFFPSLLRIKLKFCNLIYSLLLTPDEVILNKKKLIGIFYIKRILEIIKPFEGQNLSLLEKRISHIKKKSHKFTPKSFEITFPQKIKKCIFDSQQIIVVNPSNIKLLELLSLQQSTREILAIDINEEKGNSNYNLFKIRKELKVTNAVFNFCFPLVRLNTQKPPSKRFISDTVFVYNPKELYKDLAKPIKLFFKVLSMYVFKQVIIIEPIYDMMLSPKDYDEFFKCTDTESTENYVFTILNKL